MQRDRVFVDTNTFVSAVVFEGNERRLLMCALDRTIRFVLADVVLRETERVISSKFPHRLPTLEWVLDRLDFERVKELPQNLLRMASRVVRDPTDVEVLASIMLSEPDVALTGDKDLLTDEVKAVAPMCRCAEYLERLEQGE